MNRTQTLTLAPAPAETSPPQPAAKRQPAPPQTGTESAAKSGPDQAPVTTAGIPRARRRQAWLLAAGIVALAFTVYGGTRWWLHLQAWAKTDNAYVAAHVHTISARVPGTVMEVLVEEHQEVAAGALLARLDPKDFEVRRDQARAQVAQAAAKIQAARAEVAQAQALVEREKARATRTARDLARAETLSEGNGAAISRQEYDAAKAEAATAVAALSGAESALESGRAALLAASAQEQAAQANLSDAELQLSYTELRAPAAGRIGKKNLETGNRVQPGQALLALVQPDIWITANYKETQLTHMKPGQGVRIKVDAFPGRVFTGHIESLSPASGAQFALLPPDNATGNFTRIVQRVPVKIVMDPESFTDCSGRIVPGMSAIVEVNLRS